MGSMLSRVYVVITDALGVVVARRYLDGDEVPSWLTMRAGAESVRCDVYDEAPVCGGRVLATFVPHGRTWREL
jgi:hypothetical protein